MRIAAPVTIPMQLVTKRDIQYGRSRSRVGLRNCGSHRSKMRGLAKVSPFLSPLCHKCHLQREVARVCDCAAVRTTIGAKPGPSSAEGTARGDALLIPPLLHKFHTARSVVQWQISEVPWRDLRMLARSGYPHRSA